MYEIRFVNSKIQKRIDECIRLRGDVEDKLKRLSINPFKEIGAHPLRGRLKGKWSCWLGSNIRMIYSINVEKKLIIVQLVGNHKIY
jgi:mRNA-degrading endonuclease YafQ of YafQ-DinJ toxin-antitoxin module